MIQLSCSAGNNPRVGSTRSSCSQRDHGFGPATDVGIGAEIEDELLPLRHALKPAPLIGLGPAPRRPMVAERRSGARHEVGRQHPSGEDRVVVNPSPPATRRSGLGLSRAAPDRTTDALSARNTAQSICDIAWKALLRLTARFRKLVARGKAKPKVATTIARELTGFIWANRSDPGAARVVTRAIGAVRPAAARPGGEPSKTLWTSARSIRPCPGEAAPRRTTVWAVPNPRILAASTVARTRCRRPDGFEQQRARRAC